MSLIKEEFSTLREEELEEEFRQDWVFIASDYEEAYNTFKEDIQKEQGIILVEGKEKEIELLPF